MIDPKRLTLMLLAACAAGSTQAQDAAAPPSTEPKLSIHGYLTQAYAITNHDRLLGIPDNGTSDYRRVALQVRYDLGDRNHFVVQLGQRRLGQSPAMQFEPDVKLDWAFYEHRTPGGFSARAGRFATPLGVYNETRYVGTLLPFYRAPYNYYQEGSFTSETVDGVSLGQSVNLDRWGLDLTAYVGGFAMTEVIHSTTRGTLVNRSKEENALGGQLWLNTPVEGLRLGFGGSRFDARKTILVADGEADMQTWIASADVVRERFKLRSELSRIHIHEAEVTQKAFYVYGGVNATEKLGLHLQLDRADLDLNGTEGKDYYRDVTAGVSYALRSDVVVKGEYHWTRNRQLENRVIPLVIAPPARTNYAIFSLSASF